MSDMNGDASGTGRHAGGSGRDMVAEDVLVSATLRPAGATQPGKAKPAFSEDDRRWFADNPGRSYRVRPIDPAEIPDQHLMAARPAGWRHFVVVRQVRPGHRIRLAFAAEGEPATGERAAERLFQACLRSLASRTKGGARITD
jgi:hypothetical protein